MSESKLIRVEDLIEALQKQDPKANVVIGATDSSWSTLGCSVSSGEWFPDETIRGRSYGHVYEVGRTPTRGITVVKIHP